MKYYELEKHPYFDEGITLCLGMFDGMHRGHQVIIQEAINLGKQIAMLDFGEDILVKQAKKGMLLTSFNEKEVLYELFDIDIVIKCSFIGYLKNLTPYEFIKDVLKKINVTSVVAGADFHFGKDAIGNIDDLVRICSEFGIKVVTIPLLSVDNTKISTSNIINFVKHGDIKRANLLLGYHYFITGTVIRGLQNGRLLGFKTANVEFKSNQICPKFGVYAAITTINKKKYQAMVNIGIHPTINRLEKPTLEVHIFDFDQEIYGLSITVEFYDYIREEKKFLSIECLAAQLKKDKSAVLCTLNQEIQQK